MKRGANEPGKESLFVRGHVCSRVSLQDFGPRLVHRRGLAPIGARAHWRSAFGAPQRRAFGAQKIAFGVPFPREDALTRKAWARQGFA